MSIQTYARKLTALSIKARFILNDALVPLTFGNECHYTKTAIQESKKSLLYYRRSFAQRWATYLFAYALFFVIGATPVGTSTKRKPSAIPPYS